VTSGPRGLGYGFDFVDDTKILTNQIFDWTYKKNNKGWVIVDPMRMAQPFVVPDSTVFMALNVAKQYQTERFLNTWTEYEKTRETSTTMKASVTMDNFSMNAAFTKTKGSINKLTKNNTAGFEYTQGTYKNFALKLDGRPALSANFLRAVTGLTSGASYCNFVKNWGTHYYTNVVYGCEYNFTGSLDTKFIEKNTEKWTKTQMDIGFKVAMFDFNINKNTDYRRKDIDGKIQKAMTFTAMARGGDETMFVDKNDFKEWIGSCRVNKAPLVRLSDIRLLSTLIPNATKANALHAVIKNYGRNGRC